jgi:hypothetical protein
MSYKTESDMEYWADGQRIKAAVPIMGKRGARVLMIGLSPAGGSRLAALACDGTTFYYVDDEHNCHLIGPCNGESISKMLRVRLEPDELLLMAVGTTPVIEDASGTIEWDSKHGYWVVKLIAEDNQSTQTLHLSGGEREWDVLMSERRNARGQVEWRLTNKEFKPLRGADGTQFRVPARSRLEQPATKGDLTVRWIDERNGVKREINGEIDTTLFTLAIPAGLPVCGQPASRPAPAATPTKPSPGASP